MRDSDWQDHHESHHGLLQTPADPPAQWPGLDAIIVPTIRHPAGLAEAARLAQILDCTLVTLHSGDLTSADRARQLLPTAIDLVAINVAQPPERLNLPPWETSRLLRGTVFARRTDLSAKRNLALMLSRMLGWSRILFLDDDITAPDLADIKRASGLLETHNAVGLHIGGFPDQSVVCHAYRLAGGLQQSFIGGGALAVATERCGSFFPDIYNEDWLFMLDPEGFLQPITCAGEVCQASFDPFHDVGRARREEFGDVLAEGAYWLLDQRQSVLDADEKHWDAFLLKRKKFIYRVLDMIQKCDIESSDKRRVAAALNVSLRQLAQIKSDLCQRYLRVAWRADRKLWQSHLGRLPTGQTCQQALRRLSARGAPLLTWHLARGLTATGSDCR
jgi:hypothetical protein